LERNLAQCKIIQWEAGTPVGLHFQVNRMEKAKLFGCTQGAIYDVAVDIDRAQHDLIGMPSAKFKE